MLCTCPFLRHASSRRWCRVLLLPSSNASQMANVGRQTGRQHAGDVRPVRGMPVPLVTKHAFNHPHAYQSRSDFRVRTWQNQDLGAPFASSRPWDRPNRPEVFVQTLQDYIAGRWSARDSWRLATLNRQRNTLGNVFYGESYFGELEQRHAPFNPQFVRMQAHGRR